VKPFRFPPLPWTAFDIGDDKTDVVDATGKIFIDGDHQQPFQFWQMLCDAMNAADHQEQP